MSRTWAEAVRIFRLESKSMAPISHTWRRRPLPAIFQPVQLHTRIPAPAGAGKQHVFVTKLTSDATSLLYSSYLSGNGTDLASGMTINAGGFVFVTGTTTSLESSSSDQFPASNSPNSLPISAGVARCRGSAAVLCHKSGSQRARKCLRSRTLPILAGDHCSQERQ